MKRIACAAALVLAVTPVSVLAEDLRGVKAPHVNTLQTNKPKEKKQKPQETTSQETRSQDKGEHKKAQTQKGEPKTPWDIAVGAAIMSEYNFRGITQSAHRPSAASSFEPRYNFANGLQAYLGLSGETISLANRAPSEIDFYGGIRSSFGTLAVDFGAWYYWYPAGQCFHNFIPGCAPSLPNGNVVKGNLNFFEIYGKATYPANRRFSLGGAVYWSPSVQNSGAEGTYLTGTAKYTLPEVLPNGIGWFISADIGHWFLGTSDSFYAVPGFLGGIPYKSYTTWDAGLAFTFKQFTLDLRYFDTDLNKGDCNAFTSDHTAGGVFSTAINPGGPASSWCGATFLAKLSIDLTADNLKKSGDNKSGDNKSDEKKSEEKKPKEKRPEEKRPGEKKPGPHGSGHKAAQKKKPQQETAEKNKPEAKKSGQNKPEEKPNKPEENKPEEKKSKTKKEWDIAFGAALMSEFNIRGISASDHRPAVLPYFEPRYNFSDSLQAYLRLWANPVRFPNRAPVAINVFAGTRPTFGKLALDYGFWLRWFPGGRCVPAPGDPGICLVNADLSYWEIFAKATYNIDKRLSFGGGAYWSPSVLNSGDPATYVVGTAKYLLPTIRPWNIGWYLSGDLGHWFREGTPYPSYTNWNVGLAFTWKQFTFDLRYSDTDLVNCDVARVPNVAVNPGLASDHCRSTFIGKLSIDLSADNLK